ncbi:hypothetical protein ACJDU8_06945 [Clostridium sp. WILCCON 0269]|uniref:Uncharacterized protein n=1 Tax=Candidatus Clostridium eludens TaxID=3381663 RepID=A0ABW8SI94_9CLOT
MKKIINWRFFFVLLTSSIMVTILIQPFTLALSPTLAKIFTPTIFIKEIIQAIIEFSFVIFLGLYLSKRIGFGLPILEGVLKGNNQDNQGINFKSIP